jgi:hypothetical protein
MSEHPAVGDAHREVEIKGSGEEIGILGTRVEQPFLIEEVLMHLGSRHEGPIVAMELVEPADPQEELPDLESGAGDQARGTDISLMHLENRGTILLVRGKAQQAVEKSIDGGIDRELGLAHLELVGGAHPGIGFPFLADQVDGDGGLQARAVGCG